MSDIQLLYFTVQAIMLLVVAVPILLLILWIVNKWILKGKIRLLYRILLSIGLPLAFIGFVYAAIHHETYSTSNMDNRLKRIGVEITLPSYEITEYKNEHVIADDFRDIYQMVFEDASIKSLKPTLDSLCNASDKWTKRSGEYIFNSITPESELSDSLIIRPDKGMATFIRYMW